MNEPRPVTLEQFASFFMPGKDIRAEAGRLAKLLYPDTDGMPCCPACGEQMKMFARGETSHGHNTARARVRCDRRVHSHTIYSTQFRGVFGSIGLPLMAAAARLYLSQTPFTKASLKVSAGNYARISQLLQAAQARGDIVDRDDLRAKNESTRISAEARDAARQAYSNVEKNNPLRRKESTWETHRRKERERIEAIARADQRRIDKPDEFFSPEETERRFNAVLRAAAHTAPVSAEELARMNRDGELPVIHEMTTEQMEEVANRKSGEVQFVGRNGGALPETTQAAIKERGGRIDDHGHGYLPLADKTEAERTHADDAAWRRWEDKVARGDIGPGIGPRVRKALDDEEKRLIAEFNAIKRIPPKRPRQERNKALSVEADKLAREALAYVTGAMLSPEQAVKQVPGASLYRVKMLLRELKATGQDTGLAEYGIHQNQYSKISQAMRNLRKKR